MSQDEDRRRLMTYPKEVLVDYLLAAQFRFLLVAEINWVKLDFDRNLLKSRRLQAKAKALIDRSKTARGKEWWQIQDELNRIDDQLESLNKAREKLLGLAYGRAFNPTD